MFSKRYSVDMCNGSILPKLLQIALPLMLSSILQLVFNAADVIVVGNFGSEHSLEAVGSNTSLINLLTQLFIGLSTGTNVLCARYMGAKDEENVSKTVHSAMLLGVICGAILTVVGLVLADDLLRLMQVPAEVIDLSLLYLRIYFLGMISVLVYNFGSSILRTKGDTKRPLYYLTLAGVVNVLLNLLFVVVFKMDVAGVALATVISQTLSAALVVACLMRETDAYRLFLRRLKLHASIVRQILRIGIPAGIQSTIFSLSNVVIQSAINSFGPVVMAGNAAASSIEGFLWASMGSFSQSALTFTSQNVGAGKYHRINRVLLVACGCSMVFSTLLGTLLYTFGEPLVGLYDPRPEILAPALERMGVATRFAFLGGLMECVSYVIRGLGYSVLPTVVSLLGACGLRVLWIVTIFQIPQYHTIPMLVAAYLLSWTITATAHLICFFIVRRRFPKTQTA